MSQRKDISGQTFDYLTIISPMANDWTRWKCLCTCGNVVIKSKTQLSPSAVRRGYHISCGCVRKETVKRSRWTGYKDIPGTYLKRLKANATSRQIPFLISEVDLWDIFKQQDDKCALTGVNISFEDNTASVDRINSSRGYEKGNVQWVHKTANSMKWNFSQEEFTNWCNLVVSPMEHTESNESCKVINRMKNWKGFGNIPLDFFSRYRKASHRRELMFDVSIEMLWEKFIEQRGYCAITGVPIKIGSMKEAVTASVDRIDNLRGYFPGNFWWVHKDINQRLRKDMDLDTLKEWCTKVVEFANENPKY